MVDWEGVANWPPFLSDRTKSDLAGEPVPLLKTLRQNLPAVIEQQQIFME